MVHNHSAVSPRLVSLLSSSLSCPVLSGVTQTASQIFLIQTGFMLVYKDIIVHIMTNEDRDTPAPPSGDTGENQTISWTMSDRTEWSSCDSDSFLLPLHQTVHCHVSRLVVSGLLQVSWTNQFSVVMDFFFFQATTLTCLSAKTPSLQPCVVKWKVWIFHVFDRGISFCLVFHPHHILLPVAAAALWNRWSSFKVQLF